MNINLTIMSFHTYFAQSSATIVRYSHQKPTSLRSASANPLDRHSSILYGVDDV